MLPEAFVESLHRLGLEGSRLSTVVEQFLRYRQELLDWNTRINLTAITDPEEVLFKHFLDSLSLLLAYDKPQCRLLDIGSGAGFPGLPLKIVRLQWQVTLLEATGKKVTFLRHMIEALQLEGVEAVHGRAEELAHSQEYRASFDVVTARRRISPYSSGVCRAVLPRGRSNHPPEKRRVGQGVGTGKTCSTSAWACVQGRCRCDVTRSC